jgi:predicted nucleic acid-binding protein
MRRLVPDTNIYIDWINARRHEAILFERDTVKHLSAVVVMELLAGAFSTADRKAVRRLESVFAKADRIVTPSAKIFAEAGDVLRRLEEQLDVHVAGNDSIANDVLIALSARSIGAAVVTGNGRHYRAIQSVTAFRLVVVE